MRKKIVAGNWKMNTNIQEGLQLADDVSSMIEELNYDENKFGVIIAPPYTHLYAIAQILSPKIGLSSQNIAAYENGAYTGEISTEMAKSVGVQYVILGHSERRKYFAEGSSELLAKVKLSIKDNLTPIFCIGEVLEERNAGKHFEVVERQIKEVLFELPKNDFEKVIIAYEPVWAIGTGETASPEQAQEIHSFIRKLIVDKFGNETAENTTILYGGSCKPSNADGLFSQADIDGGLIGGASLKAKDFIELIKIRTKY